MGKNDRQYFRLMSHGNDPERERWFDALERTGVHAVRVGLSQHDTEHVSFILVGGARMPTGYAEEWLGCKDRQRKARSRRPLRRVWAHKVKFGYRRFVWRWP